MAERLSKVTTLRGELPDTEDDSRRPHVLVVEDDADCRELLEVALAHEGYAVASAANGLEALGYLHTRPLPDLVVTDLSMPRMNGWQFLAEKNADPKLAGIPVIVLSAVANMKALPAVSPRLVLAKPVELDDLLEAIAAICSERVRAAASG